MEIAKQIDDLVNQVILKAENQHELLFGLCQSGFHLTNTQEHILMLLAEESLTNTQLAKRLTVTQAAVTKAVKNLIQQGLIVAEKQPRDARVIKLSLTEQALPVAQEHAHHHYQTLMIYKEILNQFSDAEQETIQRFVSLLAKEMEVE